MIEHYAIYDIQNLTDRFDLTDGVPKGIKPRYNISPTQKAPVITMGGRNVELTMMNWGLVSQGAKDFNSVFRYKTFNTPSEKVFTKPSWDSFIRSQRCIIPVNGFYMTHKYDDHSDTYYFTDHNDALFGLAGIYSVEPGLNDGAELRTFTMLTIEANHSMPLPFARMPVFIHLQDEKSWLDSTIQDFSTMVSLMRPFEGEKLHYRKVSNQVTSAKIDSSSLINPI